MPGGDQRADAIGNADQPGEPDIAGGERFLHPALDQVPAGETAVKKRVQDQNEKAADLVMGLALLPETGASCGGATGRYLPKRALGSLIR